MTLDKLAYIIELKYDLISNAAEISEEKILKEVKRDILDAYKLYFSRQARDSMFQYAADLGHVECSELVYKFDKLVADLDKLSPIKLIKGLNEVLEIMYKLKSDPEQGVRKLLHSAHSSSTQSQRNAIERLKSKFERSMKYSFGLLQKTAIKLQVLVPDVAVHGGQINPKRKELSRDKYIWFMHSPAAQTYGLDQHDVMAKVLFYPELKEKITTLINAIDRGHIPLDGSEVAKETENIMKAFSLMNAKNNNDFFESSEEDAYRQLTVLPPEEEWSKQMQEAKHQKSLEREDEASPEEEAKLEALIKKRDEDHKSRQIEEDRSRHVRSEGSVLFRNFLKRHL